MEQAATVHRAKLAVAVIFAAFVVNGCAAPGSTAWQGRWGGSLDKYSFIFDEADCAELETLIVDIVTAISRTSPTEERLDRSRLVQAAFRRMVQLSCAQAYRQ